MTRYSLFRKEAVQHAQYKHLGRVFLNIPWPYRRFSIIWCMVVLTLLCILCNQEYAEKWMLKGFINVKEGVTHTYVLKTGVIEVSHVYDGKLVKRGDVLFVVNTSDSQGSHVHAEKIDQSFKKRLRGMQHELIYKQQFLKRLVPLLKKQYIARELFDQKREEIVVLKNQIHQLESEEAHFYQSQKAYIKAPISGMVSSVMAHVGQHVSPDKPLVSILPEKATYVAQLYVPVEKAGFLKMNDVLALHYDAYPYQRFGAVKAKVTSMSQSILTDKDEDKPLEINQPYYKAVASLETPFIRIHQAQQIVQQGMTFTAVAMGMKRKVWEWLFFPVFAVLHERLS